jgi:hypothetical protein
MGRSLNEFAATSRDKGATPMATAPATPIQKPRREMQTVKAPEQFQFTKLNQMLSGVLLAIEPKEVKGKHVPEYLISDESGKFYTCLATADLERKMQMVFHRIHGNPLGFWFDIRYTSDDSSFQKENQSAMKVFDVQVGKSREAGFEYLVG